MRHLNTRAVTVTHCHNLKKRGSNFKLANVVFVFLNLNLKTGDQHRKNLKKIPEGKPVEMSDKGCKSGEAPSRTCASLSSVTGSGAGALPVSEEKGVKVA